MSTIFVKAKPEDSSQKIFNQYNKRVNKSAANKSGRAKASQFFKKALCHLKKKTKALSTVAFLQKKAIAEKTKR
jgi:hypothetical protein